MSQVNLQKLIEDSGIFSTISSEDKKIIEQNTNSIKYKKGETICKQGAFATHILFLTEGIAKTYLEGANDKNLIVDILKPNELIGLSSLYEEKLYHYSVASITKAEVCFVEKTAFLDVLKRNPDFAADIMALYCQSSRHYFAKIKSLGNKQLHGRFADAILYLSRVVAMDKKIDLSITRKEIGELAGISTESAIRLLSELNHDGILKLQGKSIEIIKENLLDKLSEIG